MSFSLARPLCLFSHTLDSTSTLTRGLVLLITCLPPAFFATALNCPPLLLARPPAVCNLLLSCKKGPTAFISTD